MGKFNELRYKIKYLSRNTSSLKFVVLAICIHCLFSVLIIYRQISFYEIDLKRFPSLTDKRGGITPAKQSDELNLIVSDIISEKTISYNGWWFDHHKYDVNIECFDAKWAKCIKVFSCECRSDSIRAAYQFVPIRHNLSFTTFELSLKATSDGLEQTDGAFFGIYVIISLTSYKNEIINIEFPPNTQEWSKRSLTYTSPVDTSIVDITLMLTCSKYNGHVSFSDIYLIPKDYHLKGRKREENVANCVSHTEDQSRPVDYGDFKIDVVPFSPSEYDVSNAQITLVVHVSLDRLSILEKTLKNWLSPVSLTIFVSECNKNQTLKDWQSVYIQKKLRTIKLSEKSTIQLVFANQNHSLYPTNIMRNIAINNVQTRYMLMLDADFEPSENLEREFIAIKSMCKGDKVAYVVPAFEYIEPPFENDNGPRHKEELLQIIFREDPLIAPFRIHESEEAHKLTNYWRWYSATKPYKVSSYSDKYEPYILIEKIPGMPQFDPRFEGYGMNKVSHISELYAAGYSFCVLPKSWVVHHPHKSSHFNQEFLLDPHQRLKNRHQRFQFIKRLIKTYNLKQSMCE